MSTVRNLNFKLKCNAKVECYRNYDTQVNYNKLTKRT
jgi:hypothetical protein